MTARDQVIAAVAAALLLDQPDDGPVEIMPSGDPDAYPLRRIFDDGQDPDDSEAGSTRYALTVAIEGHVEHPTQAQAYAALNAMHARVVRRMMAEPPLGDLVEEVRELGMKISDPTLANTGRLRFAQDFEIVFVTLRGDPFTLSA